MKIESFLKSDGTAGESYRLEVGDELVCRFDNVKTTEKAVVLKSTGKPTIIKNHFIGVRTSDGKEIVLTLTNAQADQLNKKKPLTGKTIVGRAYKNAYGDQIGVTVRD